MKKLIYLLLLPLVVAVTACGGKVNSKKERRRSWNTTDADF